MAGDPPPLDPIAGYVLDNSDLLASDILGDVEKWKLSTVYHLKVNRLSTKIAHFTRDTDQAYGPYRHVGRAIHFNIGEGTVIWVRWLSRDNRIKQRRAWLMLLGWMTAERSCPCKQFACPACGGGSEVIFKLLVLSLCQRGFLRPNCAWKNKTFFKQCSIGEKS
ncbi:hypothetical protein J6590_017341 [Homalodisca vitripennis]|nr:hypothetical protein J6590_017341 [Homalodisca vitripennis]